MDVPRCNTEFIQVLIVVCNGSMQRHALKPSYAAALTETFLRRSSPGVGRLSLRCNKAYPGAVLRLSATQPQLEGASATSGSNTAHSGAVPLLLQHRATGRRRAVQAQDTRHTPGAVPLPSATPCNLRAAGCPVPLPSVTRATGPLDNTVPRLDEHASEIWMPRIRQGVTSRAVMRTAEDDVK